MPAISETHTPILIDLNQHYGLLSVSGVDAATFLQGQLTCDITDVTVDQHRLGAYCNLKGRIRALFRIFLHLDTYYLQLPIGVLPSAMAELKKYARFSKVTIQDVSPLWYRLGIFYPTQQTHPTLLTPFKSQFPFKSNPFNNHQTTRVDGTICLSLPSPAPRMELLGPYDSLQTLIEQLSDSIQVRDFEFWKSLDIQAGIPEIWSETIEQLLPHSIDLPALGAVSFQKGCYCGQEIVARMEYRATLKRHMYRANLLETSIAPLPGSKLYTQDQEEAGTVISASLAQNNTVELLIETLDSYVVDNQKITVNIQNKAAQVMIKTNKNE